MLKKANVDAIISGKEEDIAAAGKILLPGMGHFDNCMERLNASGLRNIIEKKALEEKIPVLGICVGLQMFMEGSEEGVQPGLGWVKGKTIRFNADRMKEAHKIPNMGWLEIQPLKPSPLLAKRSGRSPVLFCPFISCGNGRYFHSPDSSRLWLPFYSSRGTG